jgi:selenocysteine-specific elongation factor
MRLQPVSAGTIEDSGTGLISVREPLPARMGDRFIIREVGRRAVVAGGRVLDAAPSGRLAVIGLTAPALRKALDHTAADRAQALLEARGVAGIRSLDIDSGGGSPLSGIFAGDIVASLQEGAALAESLEFDIRAYQEANPLRPGTPKASLATGRGVAADLLDAIVEKSDRLVDEGAWARTADFSGSLSETDDASWRAARTALAEGLAVPRAGQLGLDQELLHALARSGQVVRIDDDLYYLPEQIEQVTGVLATLESEFTVAQFRDALAVSRRHAIPLLEWLDAQSWTVRRGDVRSVRTPSEG